MTAYTELLTDKSRPNIGDVLITKDGTLGRVAIACRDNICINQSVALVQPDREFISSEFLALSLQAPYMQKKLIGDAGGSTIKHIYITKLAKTNVALPPRAEQLRIVERMHAIQQVLQNSEDNLHCLGRHKAGLMQDLLTGRVRVKGAA